MPLYTFQCGAGHLNEVHRTVSEYTETVACLECGAPAFLIILRPPAVHGIGSAGSQVNEALYRQHNITRHLELGGRGGIESADPVSPAQQCQCGNCSAHRRANPRTGTADVGKGV